MIWLRKILFPLALLYWCVTFLRNWLYDIGVLKSYSFDIPVITVGNLSVGGTGKTPQIEYLIRLLSDDYQIAVLSRGYKRKSKGFLLADETATAASIGDEPFQLHAKFPMVQVAVDVQRKNGIQQLLQAAKRPDVILLDDAFQHRKVKAGLSILLTAYDDLFYKDFILPFGNLRESAIEKKRADIILVTKCPNDLSDYAQQKIIKELQVTQPVYFSTIHYDNQIVSAENTCSVSEILKESKVLVAGIAKPNLFFDYIKKEQDVCFTFPDHHHFSKADCEKIKASAQGKKIVTTEKDFVRLRGMLPSSQLYYLPIRTSFLNATKFDTVIKHFVQKRNK
jgi:tetraacyldisaccharide 4'-kinase